MQYFITFLEGFVTFISPCLLPMLPVYFSYFAGGGERTSIKTVKNVLGFILGFTTVFVAMGFAVSKIGSFASEYQTAINIITGLIVIFFGLNFLGIFKITLFKGISSSVNKQNLGFFSSLLFGMVFSVGWTPCVGAFLGTALMTAIQRPGEGALLLLTYSLGLGIPFAISAFLIDQLKTAFSFIKKHYNAINAVSGGLLVVMGILMATGLFGRFIAFLSENA